MSVRPRMMIVQADQPTLSAFFDAWPLFADAVWAAVWMGGTLGLLGIYVIARRLVFLSAALSQAASLGVATSFFVAGTLGVSGALAAPTLWSLLATGLVVLFFARPDRKHTSTDDETLGIIYLIGIAGTLALGTRIVADLADIQTLLFGTAVAVVPDDLAAIQWTCAGVVAVHLVLWRGFSAVSLDPIGATVRQLPTHLLNLLLLASLALVVSVCTRILGALPAFAFSVLPALVALQWSRNIAQGLWIAAGVGAVCGFVGYLAAFLWALPVGASQALVGVVLLMLSVLGRTVGTRVGLGGR
ncbi:MAG: metal ABC transporter permease [Myxococcales bacterium]|nr:metal ABC transporter permease [Myxococcales bacterium]